MFTVYSKPACPQCEQAKTLLTATGQQFEVVHLDVGQTKVDGEKYISRDDLLSKFPGARMMPQISNEGAVVGGLVELKKLLAA